MSTKTNDLVASVQAAAEQLDAVMQKVRQDLQASLSPKLIEIVKEYSDVIRSFSWKQYAPYFNDGEACEFSVHEEWTVVLSEALQEATDCYDEIDSYELEVMRGEPDYHGKPRQVAEGLTSESVARLEELAEKLTELMGVLSSYSLSDAMGHVFGTDNIVIVTDETVDSESYGDHD